MKNKKEEYSRFKHLLEYFVAHLEYFANSDSTSIGYGEYIKPLVDRNAFKSSGQGYNGQAIQTQVREWEKYQNGIICINVYGANYKSRGTYLNWKGTGANIMADWNSTHIRTLFLVYYEPDSGVRIPQGVSFTIKELGLFDGQVPNENICVFFDKYNIMIENIKNKQHKMEINRFVELLKANSNLILTGAPGTGKTYMAKAIAEAMGAKVGFVQFHPSYDYTDFVEGLRPFGTEGNVGFKRTDGVFKEFCAKALNNTEYNKEDFFSAYNDIVKENDNKDSFEIKGNINNHPGFSIHDHELIVHGNTTFECSQMFEKACKWNVDSNKLQSLTYQDFNDDDWKDTAKSWGAAILNEIGRRLKADYYSHYYVFIIDEINRGEISKIFGELFFSIDPGYRGEKGKVNTQYQNMIEDGDVFKEGFYVPENVYIIGTMNDIDRSVESMDFAMRRRFAWQEVTAEESYANMIENDSEFAFVKDEIKARMFNLNKAIAETEGLDEAYQIGAAYFRKYLDYQDKANPFDCLWDNHLKGLLFEYLRGNRRAKELLEKLHKAYNKTSTDE